MAMAISYNCYLYGIINSIMGYKYLQLVKGLNCNCKYPANLRLFTAKSTDWNQTFNSMFLRFWDVLSDIQTITTLRHVMKYSWKTYIEMQSFSKPSPS